MSYASHLQCRTTKADEAILKNADGTSRCVKDVFRAAIEGDVACLEANIKLGADVNKLGQPLVIWGPRFEKSGLFGAAPLHYACAYGRESAVKFLLSKGARPDLRSASGLTCRDYARRRNYVTILAMLDEVAAAGSGGTSL